MASTMSDQAKLVSLSDSLVGDTIRSAGATRAFAEGGEVQDEPIQEPEESGPWDDYSTPGEQETQEAGPWDDYKTEYSAPAEAAKRIGKAVLPGVAGLAGLAPGQVAGQAIGRGLGTLGGGVIGGPPGAIVGGNIGQAIGGVGGQIIGAALTSVAAREAEEWLLDKLGWNTDKEKEAAFQQDYPKSAAASDIAGSMVGMSSAPGAALGTRALMGGVQGAIEAGSEYLHTGDVDPSTIAMATAAGAAFPGVNKLGQAAENLGQRLTGKVRGYVRPDQKPTQATEQPATEQPATEQPATEQPATEQPATEQPATENPEAVDQNIYSSDQKNAMDTISERWREAGHGNYIDAIKQLPDEYQYNALLALENMGNITSGREFTWPMDKKFPELTAIQFENIVKYGRPGKYSRENIGETTANPNSPWITPTGVRPKDNVAPGAETNVTPEKTSENIAEAKTAATPGGRNLASSSLATSHADPAPSKNDPTIGNPQSAPVSDRANGPTDANQYKKTAGSNVEPIAKGAEGYPTATVGEPARGNISPEIEHALTGEAVDPNTEAPERIRSHAIRVEGKIYEGTNHTDAHNQYLRENGGEDNSKKADRNLFVTTKGRVVNQKEALELSRDLLGIEDNKPFTKPLPDEVPHPEPTGIPEAAVTDTVTKLRDLGMDQAAQHVEENPHLEPQVRSVMESPEGLRKFEEARAQKEARAQEANRLVREGNSKRGGYKLMRDQAEPSAENAARRETEGQVANVGDETVTAASQVKARLVKRAADAAQSAFDKFATGKIGSSDYNDLSTRLRDAIAHAKGENTDIHALTPMPRKRTPAQEWLKAAQELVGTPENPKTIRPTKALKFLSDERMLLNGAKAKEVSEFGRIEGDIANNKRRATQDIADPHIREWRDSLTPEDREAWDRDFGGTEKDPGNFDTEEWGGVGPTAGKKPDIDYYDRAAKFWTDTNGNFDPNKFMQDFKGIFGTKNSGYAKRFSAKTPVSWRDDYSRSIGEGLLGVRKMDDTNWADREVEASKMPAAVKDNAEAMYLAREKDDIASLPKNVRDAFYKHVDPILEHNDWLYDQIHTLNPVLLGDKVESHISRIPKGLHPDFGGDPIANVMATRRNGLKLSASQTMQREFMVVEDPQGNRTVVSPTNEGYREWHNQKSFERTNANFEDKPGTTFRDSNNTLMTVKDALTPEIEQHALFKNGQPARYYKNAAMSALITNAELRGILSHLQYLESLKPEFQERRLGTTDAKLAEKWAKEGEPWEKSLLPQMKDWYMTPRLREVMDDFASPGLFPRENTPNGVLAAARKASEVTTKLLFINPLFHIANVGTHWFGSRGWDWIKPEQYRTMAVTGVNAIRSVLSQDTAIAGSPFGKKLGLDSPELRRFQDMMREHAAGTQFLGVLNQNKWHNIAQAAGETIASNPSKWDPIARVLGISSMDLGRAIYRASSKTMWAANDVFYTQLVMEKMQKGLTMGDAIRETEKHFPAYKVPSRVISGGNMGRWISQALRDNTAFAFGPYHYGVFNSYAHIVKDAVQGTGEERVQAIGHMMALGVLAFAVYPAWDAAIKMITGNPHSEARRRGPLTIPEHIRRGIQGKEDMLNTIPAGVLTPSPLITGTWDLAHNKDFAGRPFVEPGDVSAAAHGSARAAGRVAIQAGSSVAKAYIAPYQMASRALENKSGNALAGLRDQQLLDAKTPSPAALKYEALAAEIKRKAALARERKGNRGWEENIYNRLTR